MVKTLHIEYTTQCNSRCVMCDYWKRKKHYTIENDLLYDSINQLSCHGLKNVYFTGGECLVKAKELFSLCNRLKKDYPAIELKLNTNGILLKKFAREISELFSVVVVSLDSVNGDVYKAIRGVDALDHVKEGIALLKKLSPKTLIKLRALVLDENIAHMKDLIAYATSSGIDRLSFIPEDISSSAFSRECNNLIISHHSEETVNKIGELMKTIQSCYSSQLGLLLSRQGLDLKYIGKIYSHELCGVLNCDKFINSCVIGADRLVSPCFFIPGTQRISNDKSILEILDSKEYLSLVNAIRAGRGTTFCYNCACPKILS